MRAKVRKQSVAPKLARHLIKAAASINKCMME